MHAPRAGPSGAVSAWRVAFAVGFYISTSITQLLVTKWVIASSRVGDYELAFLWVQFVVAVVLHVMAAAAGLVGKPSLTWAKCWGVRNLIALNTVGLSLNTLCLKFVDASFYQVARGLILPFTVALSHAVLKQPSSPRVLAACGVVTLGFLVGLSELGGASVTVAGVAFGVSSALGTALHAIVIKDAMRVVADDTLELVFYNNLLSSAAMVPVVVATGQLQGLFALVAGASGGSGDVRTFVLGTAVTGLVGFLINIAGFLQIQVTSPNTHMISSACKGVLQTLIAMAVFGDRVSLVRWMGIAFILGGSAWYTQTRSSEIQAVARAQKEEGVDGRA